MWPGPGNSNILLLAACLVLLGATSNHLLADDASRQKGSSADLPAVAFAPPAGSDPTTVINLLIEAQWVQRGIEPTLVCDDETFVRRLYLDLVGRIPTRDEAAEFLQETRSDKRSQLIDRLLASDEYARHMSEVFDVVLMGRRGPEAQQARRQHGWLDYLQAAFHENRPWNDVVAELLLARPQGEQDRAAVWFVYERKNQHQAIAEAIAASLFGVQIDCAQCHDHPSAYEIGQRHYWGLVAFYNRGENANGKQGPRVAESAVGGFIKFTNLAGEAKPAELTFLGSDLVVDEPWPADETQEEDAQDKYRMPDASGESRLPRVPKFSRREKFVNRIAHDNPLIARAMVNRLWALLVGRGLVHPVDQMDSKHPPSHPQLLDWLAEDFVSSGYDVRRLVRAIVASRPYQLASPPVTAAPDPSSFAYGLQKPLTGEAYYRSMLIAIDGSLAHQDEGVLAEFCRVFPDVFPVDAVSDVKQSLFLSNNETIESVIAVRPEGVAAEIAAQTDCIEQVRRAYESAYTREPADDEMQVCHSFLQARSDRPEAAVRQLMWALVTSAEFRFNH